MKTLKLLKIASLAFTTGLLLNQSSFADTSTIEINSASTEDLILTGLSGGDVKDKCGNISSTPNQVISITEPLPYLRFTVEAKDNEATGQTLLISGPGGRFCVLAEGGKAELSGYWQEGKYLVYVGQSRNKQKYTLSISLKKPILK